MELEESNLPKRIVELQSDVVDQIAAGEVVERPAHLVKELVENSIDAGATEVEVEFDQGGRFVRVTDNGAGILKDDLARALARHATSKIRTADDIWRLQSFGFRGEALASIGAVSRLELMSRPKGEKVAAKVVSEFGRIEPVQPSAGNLGTTVLIHDLFENVPARLKFMKSETAEGSQIRAVVKAAAMSHPGVGFRLKAKGKVDFSFRAGETFLERARSVTGIHLHEAKGEYEGIRAEIAFSGPQDVLGNSKGLWFFVQDRWIQDRSLQAAVIEAYRGLLMHGEYPYVVAKLWVPDGEVDVNIHPTKSAVKFREPSRAFRAISRTLRSALEEAPWLTGQTRGSAQASPATASTGGARAAVESFSTAYAQNEVATRRPMKVSDFTRPYSASAPVARETSEPQVSDAVLHMRFDSAELDLVQIKQKSIQPSTQSSIQSAQTAPMPTSREGVWSRLQILGQAGQTYLVCQDHDRLVFVDQHAAHERVAYERLMKAWKAKDESGRIETQALLIPHLVDLEPEQAEAVLTQSQELARIGLTIESIGPRTIGISSIPAILKETVVEKALKELAQAVVERGGSFVFEERIGDVFARMACHSVVRAGQALSHEEMRGLLEQMDEFPLSSFCPHGRPVSVEYPFARLERDFGRIV
ncbi:MAG: DNA mismatch repair endonuclease MutL [Bdellovibrionales bacterium]|nr:DNA mismatch repair endonuclease MutL [Bdellovibrionales bacterium]